MRSKGVDVRRLLSGTLLFLLGGIALPAAAQIVTSSGRVTVNSNPAQIKALRKSAIYNAPLTTLSAVAEDNFGAEVAGDPDGWPEIVTISVNPPVDPGFKVVLRGGQSNIVSGAFCETPGGRTVCDPSVTLLTAGGSSLCQVSRSSFTLTTVKLGFPVSGSSPEVKPFVYKLAGTYSAQCVGETTAFTGTFNINQTTTTKFLSEPITSVLAGTARCNGAGGWPNVGTLAACSLEPPVPTAELPRSGRMTLTITAEQGSRLGNFIAGKTYRFSNNDGPWITFLRAPINDSGNGGRDYDGAPPTHLEVTIEPQGSAREKTGAFEVSVKQRQGLPNGIELGSFEFEDARSQPHFELQLNLSFCTGGVVSTYTVTDYTFDCEWAAGGVLGINGSPDTVVHVVPHLRTFNVNFKTTCGNEGSYHGTLTVVDDPIFDCGTPPPAGGGTGGGGTGSGGDGGDTGSGSGGTGGDTGSGGGTSGGGGGTTQTGPRIGIPSAIATNGIQLNNQQSTTVNLTTSVPSGFNADVELAAFSEPEGLALALSPSAIAAPGSGGSVLTIAAGPDTRPQEYRVLLSATGKGVTSYSSIKVSVLCDPPMILGLDQPKNATLTGGNATLEVRTIGSPTVYQWYRGQSGSTASPVAGATGRTFTTSTAGDYWVRATNPCGSVDSNTATVK